MRFESLTLKAYGHFTDYTIPFDPNKNFHLLYGRNEAGKSTTLRSITHLLYGFPNQTTDAFLHANNKLRIEGRIKNSKGEELAFARRKGRKNTVLDMTETPLDEKVVEQFLNGLQKEDFERIYALNHEMLRQGGEHLLQSGGSAGEGLFSAASGINVLRKVIDDLTKEIGDLYKRTGTNPKLNQLLRKEKELAMKLSDNQLKIQTWKELERDYLAGKEKIAEINEVIKQLRNKQAKLERIKQMLPNISKRNDLLEKIRELGEVPDLPDDVQETRRNATEKLLTAKQSIDKLKKEIEELKIKLANISIPHKVLEQEAMIDLLYKEVNQYENYVKNIPKLEGEQKQLEEQILSIMKEIDVENADLNNVEKFRLPVEKKETLRSLIREKPTLDQQLESAQKEYERAKRELQEKEESIAQIELPNELVITELEAIVDKVKRAGNMEGEISALHKEISQKEQDFSFQMMQLPLWEGNEEQFKQFSVSILVETINKYEEQQSKLLAELEKVAEQIENYNKQISQYEEDIRNLESVAVIPSEEQLTEARSNRNQSWEFIRKRLQTGEWDERIDEYTNGQAIESLYEKQVFEADHIADTMRREAEKVGRKNKLLYDIEISKVKIKELEEKQESLQNDLKAWEQDWHTLWEDHRFIPLSPAEMKEWLTKYQQLKELEKELENDKNELRELQEERNALKSDLIKALLPFTKTTNEESLTDLLSIAERQLNEVRELRSDKRVLQSSIDDLQLKMTDCKNSIENHQLALNNWMKQWEKAIDKTTIKKDTLPNVAESLLEKYDQCIQIHDELLQLQENEQTNKKQIELFEQRVQELMDAVDVKLEDDNYVTIVNKLHAILQKAKEDQIQFTSLSNQLEEKEENSKEVTEIFQTAHSKLNALQAIAQCQTLEELVKIEEQYLQKKSYEQDLQKLEDHMLNLGSGKTIEELIDEAEDYDSDQIVGELVEIDRQIKQMEDERSESEQQYGVIKKEYEEKVQGQESLSVQIEQEKNSLHAEIASVTEQYVQLKLASILLQKGIEEYRNKNQNPIIRRAGEIFRRLTQQSFVDLTIDYNDKDEAIIVGVRENGDKVAIDGMSDGTTDQLYLSLRIAYLEKTAKESEPIPFILDDILVHFDDERSKETLRVLLELSNYTQVIFFSHHRRLLEIMQDIADESSYQMIEINQPQLV